MLGGRDDGVVSVVGPPGRIAAARGGQLRVRGAAGAGRVQGGAGLHAAHGAGGVGALSGAVDSGGHLWSDAGPWTNPRTALAYRWRRALRMAALSIANALLLLLTPLVVVIAATVVYGLGMVASLGNFPSIAGSLLEGEPEEDDDMPSAAEG